MNRAAFAALWSHWRRHPVQLATLVAGLALATALWSGVQAINAEARKSYDRAAGVLGQDQLDRLEASGGITVAQYVALRRAGWNVTPMVEGDLPKDNLHILGVDPLTAPPQPALAAFAGDGTALAAFLGNGFLLVSPETAARLDNADLPPLRIAADVPPDTAITDIGVALRLLNTDRLSHLLIARQQPMGLAPLSDITDLRRVTPQDQSSLAQLTESFHLNLTAFGLLSFAVGLFIVQSAIGLAFEQRRATFRTLRALGLGLRRLMTLLALELGAIALVSGIVGIALGYGIAAALLPDVAGTLRGLYGAQITGTLGFDPLWALSALGIALLGVTAAGAQALWRVARMPLLAPAQPRAWAMASGRAIRVQTAAALGLLTISAALVIWGGSLMAGFACLAALLIGAALALPVMLLALLRLARKFARGPLGEWLVADARQQVPALSLALMALLLALSANIGVGTMVGSFRTTFTGWLDQRLASELYITAPTADEADEIRAYLAPRSDAVLPIWSVDITLRGARAQVYGIADHATYRDNWPLLQALPEAWDRLANGTGVLINEQMARRDRLGLGDMLALADGWSEPVLGIYSDYGNPQAQLITGTDALAARYPDTPVLRFAVRVAPARVPGLIADLTDRFALPEGTLRNQSEVKAAAMNVFDQTFVVTGALNVLTLGVAGFAMLTSLLTLSTLRLPQVAPVWALGVAPRQIALAELARTALLAALTWALSIPVGLALAWVLLAVVNVQAFGWRLPMQVFPDGWLWLGLWALIAALLASAWPVWRLVSLPGGQLLRVFANDR
ncbi:ABC transporter permease [Puniceibacterium sediminis]|uniref:Putative ABC transport system permease protein n=1 Tax=Puniceibacterium sediminis TaxID=1608407 RepID=A0A238WYI9_9RHOB|nr:ABC transporter permease [Puniceibacterium sediminis]SNR51488.1 putative ABC transport system permease protein [Puniceibacterium sediminis]